jgi:hypothetical protein
MTATRILLLAPFARAREAAVPAAITAELFKNERLLIADMADSPELNARMESRFSTSSFYNAGHCIRARAKLTKSQLSCRNPAVEAPSIRS